MHLSMWYLFASYWPKTGQRAYRGKHWHHLSCSASIQVDILTHTSNRLPPTCMQAHRNTTNLVVVHLTELIPCNCFLSPLMIPRLWPWGTLPIFVLTCMWLDVQPIPWPLFPQASPNLPWTGTLRSNCNPSQSLELWQNTGKPLIRFPKGFSLTLLLWS